MTGHVASGVDARTPILAVSGWWGSPKGPKLNPPPGIIVPPVFGQDGFSGPVTFRPVSAFPYTPPSAGTPLLTPPTLTPLNPPRLPGCAPPAPPIMVDGVLVTPPVSPSPPSSPPSPSPHGGKAKVWLAIPQSERMEVPVETAFLDFSGHQVCRQELPEPSALIEALVSGEVASLLMYLGSFPLIRLVPRNPMGLSSEDLGLEGIELMAEMEHRRAGGRISARFRALWRVDLNLRGAPGCKALMGARPPRMVDGELYWPTGRRQIVLVSARVGRTAYGVIEDWTGGTAMIPSPRARQRAGG